MVYASDTECNAEHGSNDREHSIFADLITVAAVAAAACNTKKAIDIAEAEWKMAKKYWKIAKNWLDYYNDFYAPVEDQELEEAMALTEPEPEYEAARGRARIIAMMQFRGAVDRAVRCTSRYCTGLRNDMVAELVAANASAVALADGLGYRNERAYIEARDDERFQRQFATAKRGRNMIADNVSLAKATAGIYGDLWDQTWKGLEGAGTYLGYMQNRNPTAYPTTYVQQREQAYAKAHGQMNMNSTPPNSGPQMPIGGVD